GTTLPLFPVQQHTPQMEQESPHACYTDIGSNSSSTFPWLSAKESRWTPTLSSKVRCRLANGIGFSNLMCRPPFMPIAVPPAMIIGKFVWSCTFGLPMPLPYRYSE